MQERSEKEPFIREKEMTYMMGLDGGKTMMIL